LWEWREDWWNGEGRGWVGVSNGAEESEDGERKGEERANDRVEPREKRDGIA